MRASETIATIYCMFQPPSLVPRRPMRQVTSQLFIVLISPTTTHSSLAMNTLLERIKGQQTFQYDDEDWVLFEAKSFQPIPGVMHTLGQIKDFICPTIVSVHGIDPDQYAGETQEQRRSAAILSIAAVMSACGEFVSCNSLISTGEN